MRINWWNLLSLTFLSIALNGVCDVHCVSSSHRYIFQFCLGFGMAAIGYPIIYFPKKEGDSDPKV
jgi:hypothetical protein